MKHAYAWPTAISDHYFCRQITTLTHYFGIMFGIIFFCGMNIFALHVAVFFGIQIDIFNILSGIYSGIRFRIPCRNLCGILCNMLFDIFLVWFWQPLWHSDWDLELAVDTRQCPLRSGVCDWCPAVPLESGTRSWGPAVPTEIWRSHGLSTTWILDRGIPYNTKSTLFRSISLPRSCRPKRQRNLLGT